MKKMIALLLTAAVLLLSGCGVIPLQSALETPSKAHKIEILSADGTLLQTLEDPETVDAYLDLSDWEEASAPPGDAIKELELAVYQEATLLAGQDPVEPKEFVNIMRVTLYQGTNCVEAQIMGSAIPGAKIPDEFLTFYYMMPDGISSRLRELAAGSSA